MACCSPVARPEVLRRAWGTSHRCTPFGVPQGVPQATLRCYLLGHHVGVGHVGGVVVEPGLLVCDAGLPFHRLVGGECDNGVGHGGAAVAARLQVLAVTDHAFRARADAKRHVLHLLAVAAAGGAGAQGSQPRVRGAALGGIGLVVVGMPFAVLLTAVMFISAVVQIGVGPIMLGAVVWLYWTGQTTSATVLLVWTILVAPVDNILRPILIRKGADLPLLLIFAGVIGGLISFGIVGIFVGPVVLAIAYTLFLAWIE